MLRHLLTVSVICLSTTLSAFPALDPRVNPQRNQPVAILVAFNNYPGGQQLQNAVPSAITLAVTLHELGYGIHFISDAAGIQSAGQAFANKQGVTLLTHKDATDTSQVLEQWCFDNFRGKADGTPSTIPFGLIIYSGHGERRMQGQIPDDVLMTPTDESGKGGISTSRLMQAIGGNRLPVILVLDCCRLQGPVQAVVAQPRSLKTPTTSIRGGQSTLWDAIPNAKLKPSRKRSRLAYDSIAPVTTIYGAAEDKAAFDDAKTNLLTQLNFGLTWDKKQKHFNAREFRRQSREIELNADYAALEGESDLSLLSLFTFASIRKTQFTRMHLETVLKPGLVDVSMICAAKGKDYRSPPENLLSELRGFSRNGIVATPDERGFVFGHTENFSDQTAYTASHFGDDATAISSVEWKNKTLLVELIAMCPGKDAMAHLPIHIQPGNINELGSVLSPLDRVYALPYGKPIQFRLPLTGNDNQEFKSIAISAVPGQVAAWPPEATVLLTQLVLLDSAVNGDFKDLTENQSVDLKSRWWDLDDIPEMAKVGLFADRIDMKDGSQKLKISFQPIAAGTSVGRGGPTLDPPYVNKDIHQLQIRMLDVKPAMAPGSPIVRLHLRAHDLPLLEVDLPLKGRKRLDFAESGFVEYIIISGTDVDSLEMLEFSIVEREQQ